MIALCKDWNCVTTENLKWKSSWCFCVLIEAWKPLFFIIAWKPCAPWKIDMRVSKRWQNLSFWVNCHFKEEEVQQQQANIHFSSSQCHGWYKGSTCNGSQLETVFNEDAKQGSLSYNDTALDETKHNRRWSSSEDSRLAESSWRWAYWKQQQDTVYT